MVKPSLSLLALAAQAARRAAPRLRKAPIELTDAAADRVRDLLGKREKVSSSPAALPLGTPPLSGRFGQRRAHAQVEPRLSELRC